jgi:hypothetical protein
VGDHIDDIEKSVVNMPSVGATVPWLRLKGAVGKCFRQHISCHADDNAILPRGFRLIDIARWCIVETSEVPFVALSYVWGKDTCSSLLTTTRSTIVALSLDGTNTGAYFEYQTSMFYEDTYNPDTEINEFSTFGLRLQHEDLELEAFERHLANYLSQNFHSCHTFTIFSLGLLTCCTDQIIPNHPFTV